MEEDVFGEQKDEFVVEGATQSKRIIQMSFSNQNNENNNLALLLSDDHEYTVLILNLKDEKGKGKDGKNNSSKDIP